MPAGDAGQARHVRRDHPSAILRQMVAAPKRHAAKTQAHPDFGWSAHGCQQRMIGERYMKRPPGRSGAVHAGSAVARTASARRLVLQLIGSDGRIDPERLAHLVGLNNDSTNGQPPASSDHTVRLRALLPNNHALLNAICSIC